MGSRGGVRLSGMDVFHVRLHQEVRWRGLAGNSCSLVLELDGRVDEARLRERAEAAAGLLPELRWRLGRDLRLQPVWRSRPCDVGNHLVTRSLGAADCPLDATTAWLDEPTEAHRTWQLGLFRGHGADAVVLRWFHPLADARGGQRLLTWLGEGSGALCPPPPPEQRFASVDERVRALDGSKRWELLRSYRDHVLGIAEGEIVSLDAATGQRRPGRTRAVRICLDEERTAELDGRLRRQAGASETSVLVYAAARLLARALAAHSIVPEQHTVVVPVSLDAQRGSTRMFGNNLTMMMLTLSSEELADRGRALASLAAQRREVVRQRLDLGFLAALHTARYMPAPIYSWFSKRPFGGERMSVLVTHPGNWSIDSFLGVAVRDAYPLPAAVLPPGLQVVAGRHHGRLSLTVVFVDSVISMGQVAELTESLEQDVLGTG